MTGRTISKYQIIEKLGQGGMGVVYRARDTRLDRLVAIKMIPYDAGGDEEVKARFLQEARAASAMDHPNIGAIYEIDETPDGEMFIAIAYYDGETLKERIARGPLAIGEARAIGLQIARGMRCAHTAGIIHRDLKPANVMVTKDGTAKIIDFGLAKFSGGMSLTRTGTSMGTIAYMSPEQLRGEAAGPAGDLWALGVMLYEMIAGRHPFPSEFEAAMMYAIANEAPPPVTTWRPETPPSLETLVMRLLDKDPGGRPASMEEVENILDNLADKPEHPKTNASRPVRGMYQISEYENHPERTAERKEKFKRLPRQRKRKLLLLGSVIVLLAGMSIFFLLRFHHTGQGAAENQSIGIVPFRNQGQKDYEYLAAGIAADLSRRLMQIPGLLSISPNTMAYYTQSPKSDAETGKELGVRYLMRGEFTVRAAGIALTVHLFDTEQQGIIFERTYERSRDEIPAMILSAFDDLADQLGIVAGPSRPGSTTRSSKAYDSYLQGMYYSDQLTKDAGQLAVIYLEEAVGADSTFIPALLGLARTQVDQYLQGWDLSPAKLRSAEDLCTRALRKDSTNATARAILGKIADMSDRRDEGIRLLQRAVADEPANAYALAAIGDLYILETNEPLKGIVTLKQLRAIDPADWRSISYLGIAYAQNKNYPEAMQAFREAMRFDSTHAFPLNNLAYVFERTGNLDSAETFYRKAIQRDRTYLEPYKSLASIFLIQRRYADADTLLASGLRLLPTSYELLYLKGITQQLDGASAGARRIFEEGDRVLQERMKTEPNVPEYLAYHALFLARLGNPRPAIELAGQLSALDSTHEGSALLLAQIYAQVNERASMLHWYARAKGMNPEYDEAFLNTDIDFQRYRNDPDLMVIARRN